MEAPVPNYAAATRLKRLNSNCPRYQCAEVAGVDGSVSAALDKGVEALKGLTATVRCVRHRAILRSTTPGDTECALRCAKRERCVHEDARGMIL